MKILDQITDTVLAYCPKIKTKAAKRRGSELYNSPTKGLTFTKDLCKNETMEHTHVIAMLEKIRGDREWKTLAAEIGISESFLSRIRHGLCGPGPKVLTFLNLQEKTVYVKTERVE